MTIRSPVSRLMLTTSSPFLRMSRKCSAKASCIGSRSLTVSLAIARPHVTRVDQFLHIRPHFLHERFDVPHVVLVVVLGNVLLREAYFVARDAVIEGGKAPM